MEPEIITTEQKPIENKPVEKVADKPFDNRAPRDGARRSGGNKRPQRTDKERVKPEFDTKIIAIRRVTRVASGGRRFTFSVAVVSGDKKGKVGVGLGKAGDTSLAIDKATRNAKKNMIKVTLSPAMTIPHMVEAKYSSARVMIMPARGRGVVAGSVAAIVFGVMILIMSIVAATTPARVFPASGMRVIRLAQ
jgi:small subunit ribosomal protein S5